MTKPNWKNSHDYEFISLDCVGREGVAWEFLRRNKEFQSDVQDVLAGTVTDEAGNPPTEIKEINLLHLEGKMGFFDPPRLDGEAANGWLKRCLEQEIDPRVLSPEKFVIEKWSLRDKLPDPGASAEELDPRPRFELPKIPRLILGWDDLQDLKTNEQGASGDGGVGPTLLDADNVLVVFSLNERISPQWKRIKDKLNAHQKSWEKQVGNLSPGSPKSSAWVAVLRAWDAENSDPDLPKTERTMILYGTSGWESTSKYNAHLKTAKRLIEGGYRDIVRRRP